MLWGCSHAGGSDAFAQSGQTSEGLAQFFSKLSIHTIASCFGHNLALSTSFW